ncbi:MAG: insulinase family protein [Candidatus Eremiobacteraeota bacterium]|nr:insulinase family protein [Candidatus Eremiobacteraeota bacterium]
MKASLRPLLFLGLCALLGPHPALAQTVSTQPNVAQKTLSNGLQVLVVEDHAAPVIETDVWYRFGSLYETPGKTGLAHALEHMMFRGSEKISASGLDDIVARLGATMNAETTYDYTHFFFVMPADKLDVALGIEADRMRRALMLEREWRVERGAVLSELDGDASSPFFSLQTAVRAAAYPNSPAGSTPIGKRADVAAAHASDIATYYHKWYHPNNATLVVTGDVRASAVFAAAQRDFGSIPNKTLPAHSGAHPANATGKIADSAFPFPYEVLDIAYAVPGDSEPGEPEISTLATLINNQRGPFYRGLVESNVALAVIANSDTQLRGGLLNTMIVMNSGHRPDEAQAIFQNIMTQSIKNGFDPELLSASKRGTIAERVLGSDSISGLANIVGYTYGIVREKVADEDRRIAAITPASFTAVASKYLSAPTVVGHLSPNTQSPNGNSQKITSSASDNFSSRVPNGTITEPPAIARSIRIPTQARSKLNPSTFKLQNGLTLIVQPRTDRPIVSMRGFIDSGAKFEPEGKAGIERLASDVANFGSEHYEFAAQRKAIDDLGAQINLGQTFSAKGLASDLEPMLRIVADGEEHPAFPDRYFTQERDQLAGSIEQENNVSGQAVNRVFLQRLLAPNDPSLRFPTKQGVAQMTRADLLDYTGRYWRPDLTTISIVGDVTPERARAAVEQTFGTWKNTGPKPDTNEPPLPRPHAERAYVGTGANDVFIQLGQAVMARTSEDYDAFTLLDQILAGPGSFESRLMNEMRQKRGLVYSVSSRIEADRDRGDMVITLSAAPQNVVAAVRFVRGQLSRLQNSPVSQTELTEAKARVVSGALLSEESPAGELSQIQSLVRFGLPRSYYATLNERYGRVTPADIQRVAKKYLRPAGLIEVYAGPDGAWAK